MCFDLIKEVINIGSRIGVTFIKNFKHFYLSSKHIWMIRYDPGLNNKRLRHDLCF